MSERRTLVLLPGMDGSAAMFGPLLAAAPPGIEALPIGYPAGGANRYEDLLPQVTRTLPGDRPYFLLGWSFSGPLALMIAAARPPGLRGVILAASFAARPIPYLPRWTGALVRPGLFRLYPAFSQVKALLGRQATGELRALLAEAHAGAGAEALACRARAAMAVDATSALAACTVPILYLRSRRDEVIPGSRADALKRLAPAMEIVELDGPHLALITDPAAAWAALGAFMDRVDAGR